MSRKRGGKARRGPPPIASRKAAGAGTSQLRAALDQAGKLTGAGRYGDAEQIYRKILSQNPNQVEALHGIGVLAQSVGKSQIALEYLTRAAAQSANVPMLQSHLGVVHRALGNLDEALAHHRKALVLAPDSAAVLNNLGNTLKDLEQLVEAEEHFRAAVRLAPTYPEAHRNLGITLRDQGKKDEAMVVLQTAVELRPLYCEAQNDLGALYRDKERDVEAETCFRTAIKANPNFAASYVNLAGTLQRQGKTEEPPALYRKAVELKSDLPEAYLGLGSILEHEGNVEEALVNFRKALAIKPELGNAYLSIASIPTAVLTEAELAKMEALLADENLEEEQRSSLCFAMAKVNDRKKNYDKAFFYAEQANRIDHKKITISAQGNTQFTDRNIEIFTKEFFAQRAEMGSVSQRPIFILGLPRSGTTLVEQIISSHPKAYGAGEVVELHAMTRNLASELNAKVPYPDCIFDLDQAASVRLAQRYLDHLAQFDSMAERVTDKLPFNFRNLGLIPLLFPKAKIIHTRRDPRDIAISCYFLKFLKPISFAYDLRDFGLYYREYARLMEHWRDVVPNPMIEVEYEDLVANQEQRSREIVEFCGLEWDDACLNFHQAERPVHTASSWQVRQPIYKSSVQRWRCYEPHLGPLVEALGDRLPETDAAGPGA